MLEVAVLYGCDLSQVFTPIILRLYQPHSLCEKGATRAAAKAALYVFLLPPLREGRPFDPAEGIVMPKFLLAPLREGRPAACGTAHSAAAYFYSRPYVRGDPGHQLDDHDRRQISTRAPTRRATPFRPAASS